MAVGTGYKNDTVDQTLKDAQKELDPVKRQEMYNQVQKTHLDEAPFIFLFYPTGPDRCPQLRQELQHSPDRQLPALGSLAGRRLVAVNRGRRA